MTPIIKGIPDYKNRQKIFKKNLFKFFLGLIQEKSGRPVNPNRDIALLSRITQVSSVSLRRYQDDTMPRNDEFFEKLLKNLMIYFNITEDILQPQDFYSVDLAVNYGKRIRVAAGLDDDPIETVKEEEIIYIPERLREIIEDPILKQLMNITQEEINTLSLIKFPKSFPVDQDLYKYLLVKLRENGK